MASKWGYWVKIGKFEGGFEVPEGEKAGELYDDIKLVLKNCNPSIVDDEDEFNKKCEKALKRETGLEARVVGRLKEKKAWTPEQFKNIVSENVLEIPPPRKKKAGDKRIAGKKEHPLESPAKKQRMNEEQNSQDSSSAQNTKESEKTAQEEKGDGSIKDTPRLKKEKQKKRTYENKENLMRDMLDLKENQNEVEAVINDATLTGRYKAALNREILELKESNRKLISVKNKYVEEAFDEGTLEVSLDTQITKNKKNIEEKKVEIKKREEEKIKKKVRTEMMKNIKTAKGKLGELSEAVEKAKNRIEEGLAKQKREQQRSQKPRSKIETLRLIETSNLTFSVINMNGADFSRQPEKIEREMLLLGNVQAINVKPNTWEAVKAVLKEAEQEEADGHVMVLILVVDENLKSSDDEEMMQINVESFLKKLKMVLDKGRAKFEKTLLVTPPATEQSIKVVEAISTKVEEMEGEGIVVVNLLEVQKEIGEKKEEDVMKIDNQKLSKKLHKDGSGNLSEFVGRYIMSRMAKKGKEICWICGLYHSSSQCPREVKRNDRKEETASKKRENRRDEKQGSRYEDRGGKGGSRDQRLDDRERTGSRPTKLNFTEECLKCLADHSQDNCKLVGPNFKCLHCFRLGHHRRAHFAKKPETVNILKRLYSDFEILTGSY